MKRSFIADADVVMLIIWGEDSHHFDPNTVFSVMRHRCVRVDCSTMLVLKIFRENYANALPWRNVSSMAKLLVTELFIHHLGPTTRQQWTLRITVPHDGVIKSSLCKFIWRHWTYKMPVRYILSSVWVRLSILSPLSITQYVGLFVFSLPISVVMIERIHMYINVLLSSSNRKCEILPIV